VITHEPELEAENDIPLPEFNVEDDPAISITSIGGEYLRCC